MRLLSSRTTVFLVVLAGLGFFRARHAPAQTDKTPAEPPADPPPIISPGDATPELPTDRETGTLPPDFIGPIEPVLPPDEAGAIQQPTRPVPNPPPPLPVEEESELVPAVDEIASEEPPIIQLPLNYLPGALIPPTLAAPVTNPYSPTFTGLGDTALTRVLDRTAATLIPTTLGGVAGAAGGADLFRRNRKPRINLRSLAIDGSITIGGMMEKGGQSNSSSSSQNWEPSLRVTPAITATLGSLEAARYLTLDYALSTSWGETNSADGNFDQVLHGEAFYGFAKLRLSLAGDYSQLSGYERDAGGNANRTTTGVALNAVYPLSAKTNLVSTTSFIVENQEGGVNSKEWSTGLTVSRQFTFKTQLGLGGSVGALSTDDDGGTQTIQQINLQWSYAATPKLSFAATVGYQFREIDGRLSTTPVFSGSASYQIRPRTSLQLAAARSVSNSPSQKQTNQTTNTVIFGISQQIGDRTVGNLTFGYQGAEYDSTTTGNATGRKDDYYYVRPSLAFRVAERLSISVYYTYGDTQSTERPYQTQQFGLNATVPF